MNLPHGPPCRATTLVAAAAAVVVGQEPHYARPPRRTRIVSEVVPEYEARVRVVSTAYTRVLAALHGPFLPHLVPLLGTPRSSPKKSPPIRTGTAIVE